MKLGFNLTSASSTAEVRWCHRYLIIVCDQVSMLVSSSITHYVGIIVCEEGGGVWVVRSKEELFEKGGGVCLVRSKEEVCV